MDEVKENFSDEEKNIKDKKKNNFLNMGLILNMKIYLRH